MWRKYNRMILQKLEPARGARKAKKRIGRGTGNGHGKTSCRGHNGYGSRSGSVVKRGFEGGQMPLQRRLPKRGFTNIFREDIPIINLGELKGKIGEALSVDAPLLQSLGLLKPGCGAYKILGNGEIDKAITIKANAFSRSAVEKIEKAGGKAEKC